MPQKPLHYELDYFIDLKRQIAVKRFSHKKFWNVALHCVTSWLITWCGFYFIACFLPSIFQIVNLVFIIILCVSQDTNLGVATSLGFFTVYYHASYLTTLTFLQTLSLLMLVGLFQTFVGQKWIEGSEPFSGPLKSESTLFIVVDWYNDLFVAPFYFLVTFLLRLDFREDLRWQSDTELRKIMTRTQPCP